MKNKPENLLQSEHGAVRPAFRPIYSGFKLAPFALLRINSLSSELANRIVSSNLCELIDQYLDFREELSILREPLCDSLTISIPNITNGKIRHFALDVRRAVFSEKTKLNKIELLQYLQSYMDEPGKLLIGRWRDILIRTNALEKQITILSEDESDLSELLAEALNIREFSYAISAASHVLSERAHSSWDELKSKRRRSMLRGLFSYLRRGTFKTSPFSSFTLNKLISTRSESRKTKITGGLLTSKGEAELNRGVPALLAKAIGNSAPDFLGGIILNPTLHNNNNIYFCNRYEIRHGMAWLEQHMGHDGPYVDQAKLLFKNSNSPVSMKELIEKLEPSFEENISAEVLLKRLLRQDILRPAWLWDAHEPKPAISLAKQLSIANSELKDPRIRETIRALKEMEGIVTRYPEASLSDRVSSSRRISSIYRDTFKLWSLVQAPAIRTPILENSWAGGISVTFGRDSLDNIIKRVSKVISNKLRISHEYYWLISQFVDIYGKGGVCTNAEEFAARAWGRLINIPLGSEIKEMKGDADAKDFRTPVKIPLTVFLQFEADKVECIDDPDCRVIVNLAYKRAGWQSIRYTNNESAHSSKLTEHLKLWLAETSNQLEPVAITVSGDSHNLQSGSQITDRELALDYSKTGKNLGPEDLVIKHDVASGLLTVSDSLGVQIDLRYLGAAVPMPAWGPRYIYTLLCEPFDLERPNWHMAKVGTKVSTVASPVRHQRRLEVDRVVLIRETWWVKSEYFVQSIKAAKTNCNVIATSMFARDNDIPFESFVNGQSNSAISAFSPSFSKLRKPQWCDLRSETCVSELLSLAKDVEWLVFREAIPKPSDQWLHIAGKPHVAELLVDISIDGHVAII